MLGRIFKKILGDASSPASDSPAGDAGAAGASAGPEFGALLPFLLGTALVTATLVLVVVRFTSAASPRVVVFDIIKYTNAQRAVASKFLGGKNSEEAAPLLIEVGKRTRATITEVAGPGTLVVIRQSILQGEGRDITDEVLKKLGLPTDVPTADPARYAMDVAPTLLGSGPRYYSDTPVGQDRPAAGATAKEPGLP